MVVVLRGVVPLVLVAFWVWCVIDLIRTDQTRVEYLPKLVWLMLVVFVPLLGAVAWLVLGRPSRSMARWMPVRSHPSLEGPQRPSPPSEEEEERFRRAREEALRRYYEEKRRREEGGG